MVRCNIQLISPSPLRISFLPLLTDHFPGHIAYLLDKPQNSRQVGSSLKHQSYIIPILNNDITPDHPDYIDPDTLPWWRVILGSGKIPPREANGQYEQAERLRAENLRVLDGHLIDLEEFGWFPDEIDY